MANESLWLINKLKPYGYKNFMVKSFFKTPDGHYIWEEDESTAGKELSSHAYVKLCNCDRDMAFDGHFLYAEPKTRIKPANRLPFELDFKFNHAGLLVVPLENIKNAPFDKLCKALFIQLMLYASHGYEIRVGRYAGVGVVVKPYQHELSLIECDMMVG